MTAREVVLSIPDGVPATLAFPEPETLETIQLLEAAVAQMFSALRRRALQGSAPDPGAIEYDSWSVNPH